MNKYKNLISIALKIIIGLILGYSLYYFVLMDIISLYASYNGIYIIISLLALVISCCAMIVLIFAITKSKINRITFYIVSITYFFLLVFVFFGRPTLERQLSFNIINTLNECMHSGETLTQLFLNILILMPLSYYFKNFLYRKAFIFFLVISIAIEGLQLLLSRGIFDLVDIICYLIGLNIGYFLIRKFKIDIQK